MPQTFTGGKGLTPGGTPLPLVSPPLLNSVTGFNARMPKPKGGDLETGCICKSVKIFLQDRKYAEIRTMVGVLKQQTRKPWNVKEAYVQIQVKGLLFL